MSYKAVFSGWGKLTLQDLLVAYRKAKADCYFENCFPSAIKFAEYEEDLIANLSTFLKQIQKEKNLFKIDGLLGDCRLLPKKLGIEPKKDKPNGHIHFSDPNRSFKHLSCTHNFSPEFRIVGDFPVNAHIISALWINMVGCKFDAYLDERCYGARLKRVRNEDEVDEKTDKPFHITAVGSFQPYFNNYQKWRNDGLKAIRQELENDREIIAVSLDLKSYYHLIDPTFIATQDFQDKIGLSEEKALSKEERIFTRQIAKFLNAWSKMATKFANSLQSEDIEDIPGGLVIGLTASRIVSNVLLHKWDQLIRTKLTPIHYGRYVDDMFLVLHDPGSIVDTSSFMIYLQSRLDKSILKKSKNSLWKINLGKNYQKKSKIQLQGDKQKLFILKGAAGCDLLDSIEKDINELSSEHRLMPSPEYLESSTAVQVLTAAGNVGEQADTLRRADGLTIRRLSWSLQLRHAETLAHDLPAKEWKKERLEFYKFAHNHILRPDQIFAHYQYLSRLLGFAIHLKEWKKAEDIVIASLKAFEKLASAGPNDNAYINGIQIEPKNNIWNCVSESLMFSFIDAASKYYPPQLLNEKSPAKSVLKLAKILITKLYDQSGLNEIHNILLRYSHEGFNKTALLLAKSDLAYIPYKHQTLSSLGDTKPLTFSDKKREVKRVRVFQKTELLNIEDLVEFLIKSQQSRRQKQLGKTKFEIITPFLFPTRPYTPAKITELIPECVGLINTSSYHAGRLWAKYVKAIRGVWVKPQLLEVQEEPIIDKKETAQGRDYVKVGTRSSKSVLIGITNLKTDDSCWASASCGKPKLTLERYKRISDLVNQAIQLKPRPKYLLFPEVSLPLKWVESISNRLLSAGICLIAGTEYRHYNDNTVHSEAYLALTDDRLGYPSSVRIFQPKLQPNPGEDKNLTAIYGKKWKTFGNLKKPVYVHDGFHFGVMVCSELMNSKERISFQGEVDALMILAWNQDLNTFSSLVEACALDVHAYTILVNNRKYGDSRVRSPAKESFRRDLAQLRGGKNDFCVTVELDIEKLRAFQSRAKRWTEDNDFFKPVPEGYISVKSRKVQPPK